MDYKVNFTWFGKDEHGYKIPLVENADVDVIDVSNEAESIGKIINAMRKKFKMKPKDGIIRINACENIPSPDDILALEDGVEPYTEPTKNDSFYNSDNLTFGNYTTTDFMDTSSFKKMLDSIK